MWRVGMIIVAIVAIVAAVFLGPAVLLQFPRLPVARYSLAPRLVLQLALRRKLLA